MEKAEFYRLRNREAFCLLYFVQKGQSPIPFFSFVHILKVPIDIQLRHSVASSQVLDRL
jgi:hypothetical protein